MTPLRCGRCGAVASEDEPFTVSISYTATADGVSAGLDQGDILVHWDQTGVMDRVLDTFVTCSADGCGHSWKSRRSWATAVGPAGPPSP